MILSQLYGFYGHTICHHNGALKVLRYKNKHQI